MFFTVPIRLNLKRLGVAVLTSAVLLVFAQPQPLDALRRNPESRGDGSTGSAPLLETPADTLEPNDSPASAAMMVWGAGAAPGEALSGVATITGGLDLDFYAVRLVLGDSLLATVTIPPGAADPLDPSITIMDSTGTVLANDLFLPGQASVAASYTGKYLLAVSDRSLLVGSPFTGEPREYQLRLSRLLRRGDVDGSGALDYRDAFVVFMLASGLLDPAGVEPRVLAAADVDGDGAVVGDMDDFNLLLRRVEFIPLRDWGSGGKRKSGGGATLLALAAGSQWTMEDLLDVLPGKKNGSALALWQRLAGAASQLSAAPAAALGPASPNPFNPATTISFTVQNDMEVSLIVHDVRGRLVRTLAAGRYRAGNHRVYWDGADNRGRPLASGVYFSRLVADGVAISRKLVLLK